MAYGDTCEQHTVTDWGSFEYMEFLYRLEDLLGERNRAFGIAHGAPGDPWEEWADLEWIRCDRAIEETALEFVVYIAKCRLEDGPEG